MTQPFAYVCSPYTGDKKINSQRAKQYAREIYEAGFIPISPEGVLSQFIDENNPKERADKKQIAQALMRRCRVAVLCGDVMSSEMLDDLQLAKRLHIATTTLDGIMDVAKCLGVKR